MAYTYGLVKSNATVAAEVERERKALLTGLDPKEWYGRMRTSIEEMHGQTEDYQRQELIVKFIQGSGGFWELVRRLGEGEALGGGRELKIECHVDTKLLCTVVRCGAGATESTTTVTLEMGGTGSRQEWTLSWTEKDGNKVYAFRPENPIARRAVGKAEGGTFSDTKHADMHAMRGLLAEMGALSACKGV